VNYFAEFHHLSLKEKVVNIIFSDGIHNGSRAGTLISSPIFFTSEKERLSLPSNGGADNNISTVIIAGLM
jgi:hypothetical protein